MKVREIKVTNELFKNEYSLELRVGSKKELAISSAGGFAVDECMSRLFIYVAEKEDKFSMSSTLLHELVHATDKIIELERIKEGISLQSKLVSVIFEELIKEEEFIVFLTRETVKDLEIFKGPSLKLELKPDLSSDWDFERVPKTAQENLFIKEINLKIITECLVYKILSRLYSVGIDDTETRAYVVAHVFREFVSIKNKKVD